MTERGLVTTESAALAARRVKASYMSSGWSVRKGPSFRVEARNCACDLCKFDICNECRQSLSVHDVVQRILPVESDILPETGILQD